MRLLFGLLLLAGSVACDGNRAAGGGGPPRLEPLPGTGAVAIAMNGTWVVDEVVVLDEAANATEPLPAAPGLMPASVGSELHIAGDLATAADARDLAREATGHARVHGWLNHVDGHYALYYRYALTPAQPHLADSGSAESLQFALGSVDADTLAGLVEHRISTAFPPRDRPASGLYRVRLRRAANPAAAPPAAR